MIDFVRQTCEFLPQLSCHLSKRYFSVLLKTQPGGHQIEVNQVLTFSIYIGLDETIEGSFAQQKQRVSTLCQSISNFLLQGSVIDNMKL